MKHTVFTPVYNRADRMYELYSSIKATNYTAGLEWLIIDDGSTDDIKAVIEKIKHDAEENAKFLEINVIHKENGGIHTAVNAGIKHARGEYVTRIDSDDTLLPDAFEKKDRLLESLPADQADRFIGVVGLCLNRKDGKIRGDAFPQDIIDTTGAELLKKYKIKGDRNFCMRTEIMRQFPLPEHNDTKCVPEVIAWRRIDKQYITRYANVPMAICDEPNSNSITGQIASRKSPGSYLTKYYGAIYTINEFRKETSFVRYCAMFYRALSCGLLSGQRTLKDVLRDVKGFFKKAVLLAFTPFSYAMVLVKKLK